MFLQIIQLHRTGVTVQAIVRQVVNARIVERALNASGTSLFLLPILGTLLTISVNVRVAFVETHTRNASLLLWRRPVANVVKEHNAAQKVKDLKTDGAIALNTPRENHTKSALQNLGLLELDYGHLFWSYLGSAKMLHMCTSCMPISCLINNKLHM